MPFKSKAQQRFMFSAESRGELPKGTARRWAHHTKDIKKLPEHVKKSYDLLLNGLHRDDLVERLAQLSVLPAKEAGWHDAMANALLLLGNASSGMIPQHLQEEDGPANLQARPQAVHRAPAGGGSPPPATTPAPTAPAAATRGRAPAKRGLPRLFKVAWQEPHLPPQQKPLTPAAGNVNPAAGIQPRPPQPLVHPDQFKQQALQGTPPQPLQPQALSPQPPRQLKVAANPPAPQPAPPPPGTFKPSPLLSTITTPNSPQALWTGPTHARMVPQAPGPSQSQDVATGQQLQNATTLQAKTGGFIDGLLKRAWPQPPVMQGPGVQPQWGGAPLGMQQHPQLQQMMQQQQMLQQLQQPQQAQMGQYEQQQLALQQRVAQLEAGIKSTPTMAPYYRQALQNANAQLARVNAAQQATEKFHAQREQRLNAQRQALQGVAGNPFAQQDPAQAKGNGPAQGQQAAEQKAVPAGAATAKPEMTPEVAGETKGPGMQPHVWDQNKSLEQNWKDQDAAQAGMPAKKPSHSVGTPEAVGKGGEGEDASEAKTLSTQQPEVPLASTPQSDGKDVNTPGGELGPRANRETVLGPMREPEDMFTRSSGGDGASQSKGPGWTYRGAVGGGSLQEAEERNAPEMFDEMGSSEAKPTANNPFAAGKAGNPAPAQWTPEQVKEAPRPVPEQVKEAPRPVPEQVKEAPRPVAEPVKEAPQPTFPTVTGGTGTPPSARPRPAQIAGVPGQLSADPPQPNWFGAGNVTPGLTTQPFNHAQMRALSGQGANRVGWQPAQPQRPYNPFGQQRQPTPLQAPQQAQPQQVQAQPAQPQRNVNPFGQQQTPTQPAAPVQATAQAPATPAPQQPKPAPTGNMGAGVSKGPGPSPTPGLGAQLPGSRK